MAAMWMAVASLVATAARAQDDDLRYLPPDTPAAEPPGATHASTRPVSFTLKSYVEDALTLASTPRVTVVPFPPPAPPVRLNRTSLDVNAVYRPAAAVTLTLSERGNMLEQEGRPFDSNQTFRNDLREAYVTWEPRSRLYVEVGRINVRDGAALGTNPTDFFKAGSLIAQASLDPSVIRQNRLGTLVARMQTIWNGGAVSVLVAPKLAEPASLTGIAPSGADPRFDATNASTRVLCTQSFELLGFSPELVEYFQLNLSKAGVNLSKSLGDAAVAYGEYTVGRETNLIKRAFDYGASVGDLPPSAAALWPTDSSRRIQSTLAVGASYTLGAAVTINAEYHFNQAGLSRRDWEAWFRIGGALAATPLGAAALWYPRAYASYEQEAESMHQVFVRVDWPRAGLRDLELSAFAFVNLGDGSSLDSITATYNVSGRLTVSGFLAVNIGSAQSERGSLPQALTGTGVVSVYF